MQGFGVGALIAGYCAWYTLFQKTWGDGSGYLYNLTGSTRFGGPRAAQSGGGGGGGGGGSATQSGGFTGLGKGGGGDQTGAPQGLGK